MQYFVVDEDDEGPGSKQEIKFRDGEIQGPKLLVPNRIRALLRRQRLAKNLAMYNSLESAGTPASTSFDVGGSFCRRTAPKA